MTFRSLAHQVAVRIVVEQVTLFITQEGIVVEVVHLRESVGVSGDGITEVQIEQLLKALGIRELVL